jgi:hypothetical protein
MAQFHPKSAEYEWPCNCDEKVWPWKEESIISTEFDFKSSHAIMKSVATDR